MLWEDLEGAGGEGGGRGGIRMGKTCEPKAFSFQCMTKFTTNKKKKKKMKKKKKDRARTFLNQIVSLPWGLPSHPMVRTLELPLLRVTWSGN